MPQNKKQNKKSSSSSLRRQSGNSSRGVQQERLSGDGKTFTLLTALPTSQTPAPRTYSMVASGRYNNLFTSSATVPVFAGQAFSFINVDQNAALTAIFDQYRIREIECWLVPQFTAAANNNAAAGCVASVIDLDDSTNTITVDSAGDYTSAVITSIDQGHYRHFIPHVADALYSGAFTSFGSVAAPWIDTASNTVQHYGLKFAVDPTPTTWSYSIIFKLHLDFRNVR